MLAASSVPALAETPAEQFEFAAGLYNQKLYSLAAGKLREFLTANPRDVNAKVAAYQLAAAIYRSSGQDGKVDYKAAAAAYEQALTNYPDANPAMVAAARFELTEALFQLKDYTRTVAAANAYLKLNPPAGEQAAWAQYYLGESHTQLKQPAPALAAYARVLRDAADSEAAPFAALSQGYLQLDSGKPEAAIASFAAVINRYGKSEAAPEARLRLGDAHLAASHWDEAARAYNAVLADAALSAWHVDARRGTGDAAFGAGQWDKAIAAYTATLAAWPANREGRPFVALRLGDSYFNARQWDKAINTYAPLASGDGAWVPQALYFRGNALRSQGQLNPAAADFRALIQRFPRSEFTARAALRLGDTLADAKDVAGAANAYRQVLTAYKGTPQAQEAEQALVGLAGEAASPATGAEGRTALQQALAQLPAAAGGSARLRLAQGAYNRKDWKEAITQSQAALTGTPDAATRESALYLQGSARLQSGDWNGAAANFKTQLTAVPAGKLASAARLGLAYAYTTGKQWPLAATAARETLAKLPAAPAATTPAATTPAATAPAAASNAPATDYRGRALLVLAEALSQSGKKAEAVTTLSGLRQSSEPDLPYQAAVREAALQEGLGQNGGAATAWGNAAASARTPELKAGALLKQGLALVKAKQVPPALVAFEAAATAAPAAPAAADALYEGAWAATDANLAEKATAFWDRLLELAPEGKYTAEALFQRAELESKTNTPAATEKSLGFYNQLAEKFPADPLALRARYRTGTLQYHQEQWAQAADSFEKVGAAKPNPAAGEELETAIDAAYWGAEARRKAGQAAAAATGYTRFLSLQARDAKTGERFKPLIPGAHLGLGIAAEAAQNTPAARESYTAGLAGASGETAAELNFRLGKLLVEQKQPAAALPYLLKVTISHAASPLAGEAAWLAANATEANGDGATARTLYEALAQNAAAGDWAAKAAEKLKAGAAN